MGGVVDEAGRDAHVLVLVDGAAARQFVHLDQSAKTRPRLIGHSRSHVDIREVEIRLDHPPQRLRTDDTNRRGQARSPSEEQDRSQVCHVVRVVVGHGDNAEAIDVQACTHQLAAHSVARIDEVDVIVHDDGLRRRRPLDLGRRAAGRSEQHQPAGSLAHEAAPSMMLHSRSTSSAVVHVEPIDTRMKRSEPRLEPVR